MTTAKPCCVGSREPCLMRRVSTGSGQTGERHPMLDPDFSQINDLLTRKEASTELLGMGIRRTPATLAKIFCTRSNGPPCVHIGRTPYYPKKLLQDWAWGQMTNLRTSSRQPRHEGIWTRNVAHFGSLGFGYHSSSPLPRANGTGRKSRTAAVTWPESSRPR